MWRVPAAVAVLAVSAGACASGGAGGADRADDATTAVTTSVAVEESTAPSPAAPVLPSAPDTGPPDTGPAPVLPEGFERVRATVTEPGGSECELCLWLADTADRRRRGLMFVTDLGPADGMAFVYPTPHTGSYWMRNTVLPLSIAFFDPSGGAYLDAFDMEPCVTDACPTYPTPRDFLIAVETVQGGLPGLGIVPGSVLELTDLPCV